MSSRFFIISPIWVVGTDNQRCEEFKLNTQLSNFKKIIGTVNQILRELPVMLMTAFS